MSLLLQWHKKIHELKSKTSQIVNYNNYIDTTKAIGTKTTKDEDAPINKIFIAAMYKNHLVITISCCSSRSLT